jgi:deaminated glutathione amidase
MLRASVLEFVVESEIDINLARALRLIDRAVASSAAELVVLPGGLDLGTAVDSPAPLDLPALKALADKARALRIHVVVGIGPLTHERHARRAMLLIGPTGELLGRVDARVPGETDDDAALGAGVFETSLGAVGLCLGHELMRFEAPRVAALQGAELLCASYAPGELVAADEHPSARALENAVPVLCAAGKHPPHLATCHTRSRIVGATGEVLSEALHDSEAVLCVAIERGAGTSEVGPLALRRPELYRGLQGAGAGRAEAGAPRRVTLASVALDAPPGEPALERASEIVHALASDGVQLVVLPALFLDQGLGAEALEHGAGWFAPAVRALAEACAGTPTHVVTTLVEPHLGGLAHVAVVVGHGGVVARRLPSHLGTLQQWSQLGRRMDTVLLPWGRLGLALPEELYVPELGALWARAGADVIAVPELMQDFTRARVLGQQWTREHELCVALSARGGAVVESPALSVELAVPALLSLESGTPVVVRRVRLVQRERTERVVRAASSLRPLWAPHVARAQGATEVQAFTVVEEELSTGVTVAEITSVTQQTEADGDEPAI